MNEEIKDLINQLRVKLINLSAGERLEVFEEITDNYCTYCGGCDFPCYCMKNE